MFEGEGKRVNNKNLYGFKIKAIIIRDSFSSGNIICEAITIKLLLQPARNSFENLQSDEYLQ